MGKIIINSVKAPAPIGPYSQAVKASGFVFISGQLPVDPVTNDLIDGSIEEQTRQVIENIKNILQEAGSSLLDVVKVNIYVDDIDNFSRINSVYAQYFKDECPARCFVEVSKLPKAAAIEIELVAMEKN
jgi:2-iminobutanoate/2-iminopropanoate deaminase